ncbi:MAG: diaminopimelate epimerase [Actinomycetota bacterium]
MRFRKYHGTGNDFILVTDLDARMGPPGSLPSDLVVALSDRHTGIGGDGVIRVIAPSGDPEAAAGGADYRFDLYNSDGSRAEVSGNGLRCLVAAERREGRAGDGELKILTGANLVTVRSADRGRIAVDMGEPKVRRQDVPMAGSGPSLRVDIDVDGRTIPASGVSMGNPHVVVFVSDLGAALDDDLVHGLGPRLEHHPDFPQRTNVEFVEIVSPTQLRLRTWERGAGETLACGSGACASAVAAAALERTGPHVLVDVLGGELEVEVEPAGHVWLTGGAEEIFAGEVDRDWLEARGLSHHADLVAGAP